MSETLIYSHNLMWGFCNVTQALLLYMYASSLQSWKVQSYRAMVDADQIPD